MLVVASLLNRESHVVLHPHIKYIGWISYRAANPTVRFSKQRTTILKSKPLKSIDLGIKAVQERNMSPSVLHRRQIGLWSKSLAEVTTPRARYITPRTLPLAIEWNALHLRCKIHSSTSGACQSWHEQSAFAPWPNPVDATHQQWRTRTKPSHKQQSYWHFLHPLTVILTPFQYLTSQPKPRMISQGHHREPTGSALFYSQQPLRPLKIHRTLFPVTMLCKGIPLLPGSWMHSLDSGDARELSGKCKL